MTPLVQAAQEAAMVASSVGASVTPNTLMVGGACSHGSGQSWQPAQAPRPRMADFLFLLRIWPDRASNRLVIPSMVMMSSNFSPRVSTSSM